MSSKSKLIKRNSIRIIQDSLKDFRVILVNGARQSGKTTLLRQLCDSHGGSYLTFDDPEVLSAAFADPFGFVLGFDEPLYIDEVQRAGDPLIRAIKAEVDRDPRPGRFVLAGSTRFLTVPTISESLAGRIAIIDLWPFSQGELERTRDAFADTLFRSPMSLRRSEKYTLTRSDYLKRICAGGFPDVVRKKSTRSRNAWFSAYMRTVTQRDVSEISRLRQANELPRLLRLLAALTAQELNVSQLSRDVSIPESTLRNYIPLLETVYLIHQIPAWSRNLTSKVKQRSKIYMTDSGLASYLQGADAQSLSKPLSRGTGPLLETFVVNEIAKQCTWADIEIRMHHFRDRDGAEIDLVLESHDGRIGAIEVKSGQSVSEKDFRWIFLLKNKLGDEFVHGVVFYTGQKALSFGTDLTALPVSSLWTGNSKNV